MVRYFLPEGFSDSVSRSRRRCLLTRRGRSVTHLIRFVAAPEGGLVPDVACKLPGRGAWVTADRESVREAVERGEISKSLGVAVRKEDSALPGKIEALLLCRAVEAFSLANKAGLVVCGFEKARRLISRGKAGALLHASDAAEGGRERLSSKFSAVAASRGQVARIVDCLTRDQMSFAVGQPDLVHAVFLEGGAASKALAMMARLIWYRVGVERAVRP